MATAVIRGLVASGAVKQGDLVVSNPSMPKIDRLRLDFPSIVPTTQNSDVARQCKSVFLCVKPHVIPSVCKEMNSFVTKSHVIVSVASGISTDDLVVCWGWQGADDPQYGMFKPAGPDVPDNIIRVMPNTPCLVSEGVSAVTGGAFANPELVQIVKMLMANVGEAVVIPERQFDAFTGLSGSGPAFVYML